MSEVFLTTSEGSPTKQWAMRLSAALVPGLKAEAEGAEHKPHASHCWVSVESFCKGAQHSGCEFGNQNNVREELIFLKGK